MDYQLGRQVRGTSLKNLITGRIASGQGIGHAVGAAMKDKLRARGKRWQEMFDPLNITKKMLFGSNLLTAMAGRAMGRSSRDIAYFTGINMRNRKYKDPKRSSVGPGRVVNVKVGDSETDVLAKMFNLMNKTHEQEMKRYELEKSFREEQIEEDKRRHEELIEAIINKKRVAKKRSADEMKESIEKPSIDLSGMGSKIITGMGGLLGVVATPFSLLFSGLKKVTSLILSLIPSLTGMFTVLSNLVSGFTALVTSVVLPIMGSLFKSLFINFIMGNIARMGGGLLVTMAKNPLLATVMAILGVAAGASISDAIRKHEAEERMGEPGIKPYMTYRTELDRIEQAREEAKRTFTLAGTSPENLPDKIDPIPKQFGPERDKWNSKYRKFYDPDTGELLAGWKKQKDDYYSNLRTISGQQDSATKKMAEYMRENLSSFLIPTMEKKGFDYEREELDEKGLPVFVFKHKLTGYETKTNDMSFSYLRDNETLKNILTPIEDTIGELNISGKIKSFMEDLEIGEEKVKKLFRSMSDKITDIENSVINQQTNMVNGQVDNTDATEIPTRNQDPTLQNCIRNSTVPC